MGNMPALQQSLSLLAPEPEYGQSHEPLIALPLLLSKVSSELSDSLVVEALQDFLHWQSGGK